MDKIVLILLFLVSLFASIFQGLGLFASSEISTINAHYENYIDKSYIKRDVLSLDVKYKEYYSKYLEYLAPNGKTILILAQNKINDEQLLKAYNILSFYLKDYKSFKKDKIANAMANNNAILTLNNGADGDGLVDEEILIGQPLYEKELPTTGSIWFIKNDYTHRDASYEEILHLVHDYGIGTKHNPQASEVLQKDIFNAMKNSLPKDEKNWTNFGLWGLGDEDTKDWLLELKQEGSLEQEYFASVVDAYYGLWTIFKQKGSMWGIYSSKNREEMKIKDPLGYALINSFLSPYFTHMERIDPFFMGTFKIYEDKNEPYTFKSKYFTNIRLTGDNNSNLIGNHRDNILLGNDGNNVIDGKEGRDIVQFEKTSHDYLIKMKNEKIIVIDKQNGKHVDILLNIEVLRFIDRDIFISI